MQTTGVFVPYYYQVRAGKSGEPIYLIPFGDVHRFAPLHSEDYWNDFLSWAKQKARCYFIGMGDYMDLGSASERNILADRKFHESTVQTLEELYTDHIQRFFKDIEFMRGRIIGLIEGNHYAEFQNGTTSTQRLCELLGCKYLGVSAFIRLSIVSPGTKNRSIDIWAHHGRGAARLIGGSLNRVQQMGEQAEADIYLMAHDHKKSVGTTSKLQLSGSGTNVKVVHRKQLYIRCGSFLRGYVDGQASYIADMCLNPTDLGVVKIEITPKAIGHADERVDLHASV